MIGTIYNPETGRILSILRSGKEENFYLNLPEGASWVEGEYSGNEYYVKSGAAVELPTKPDYPCSFDYGLEQWVWDEDQSWSDLRSERNRLLALYDWTQVSDSPVDAAAWALYRQELRDMTTSTADPRNPIWPTPPQM